MVVSGTNLTVAEDDNVTCIFNDNEMEGFVINEKEVLCVSPEMTITGRVPFELRIAGENSSFTGISIFISCELHESTSIDVATSGAEIQGGSGTPTFHSEVAEPPPPPPHTHTHTFATRIHIVQD